MFLPSTIYEIAEVRLTENKVPINGRGVRQGLSGRHYGSWCSKSGGGCVNDEDPPFQRRNSLFYVLSCCQAIHTTELLHHPIGSQKVDTPTNKQHNQPTTNNTTNNTTCAPHPSSSSPFWPQPPPSLPSHQSPPVLPSTPVSR